MCPGFSKMPQFNAFKVSGTLTLWAYIPTLLNREHTTLFTGNPFSHMWASPWLLEWVLHLFQLIPKAEKEC